MDNTKQQDTPQSMDQYAHQIEGHAGWEAHAMKALEADTSAPLGIRAAAAGACAALLKLQIEALHWQIDREKNREAKNC